ncbi:MAG: 6-carboxytetrahydropterin synthase [Lachnospiraceae bacterium]|nr:6-carboxytetrahydropterin synthase [Lachnospiraceae bacterium]
MKSISTFELQYAHRFYGFKGEAQYLHGHTGIMTIEVEDTINEGVNMVFPCNEIKKTAWSVLQNFDHALILRRDDPLLPAILEVYEKEGIIDGTPNNTMMGRSFKTKLAEAFPKCRLVVTEETMTVEGMIRITHDLLKDKLNISKITFVSGANTACQEYLIKDTVERCPLCGIALDERGVCHKCGYVEKEKSVLKNLKNRADAVIDSLVDDM